MWDRKFGQLYAGHEVGFVAVHELYRRSVLLYGIRNTVVYAPDGKPRYAKEHAHLALVVLELFSQLLILLIQFHLVLE